MSTSHWISSGVNKVSFACLLAVAFVGIAFAGVAADAELSHFQGVCRSYIGPVRPAQ